MKRLVLALTIASALVGCEPIKKGEVNERGHRILESDNARFFNSLETVEFEGHEYVVYRVSRGGGITHSGGCKCRVKKGE